MDHRITITVVGNDRASGPLRGIGGALSNMSQIAGGILGANMFMRLASGIQGLITKSIGATGAMQEMQVGMEGLIAREIAAGETTRELTEAQVSLSTAEKLRLQELQGSYSSLQGTLADVTAKYNSVAAAKGENSTRALELKLEMENLTTQLGQTASNMAYLEDASDGVVTKWVETTSGARELRDVMPEAQKKAAALMDELAKIAIFSPYQVETIQNTFRTAMAFGYSTDQAKDYTQALLNVAAGTGANNEMMGRMAYNLAQVRMQGRVTAVDIRQLSMAGFDLVGVLRYMGDELGVQIENHEDFNKAIASGAINWDQFTELFAKYADENFGGAAERMSRTLTGLQSTFADVFTLTMPQILGGSVELFTEFANDILDSFLEIRESPLMDKIAEGVENMTERALTAIEPFVTFIKRFFSALGAGWTPAQAFRKAIIGAFDPEIRQNIFAVVDTVGGFIDKLSDLREAAQPFIDRFTEFITTFVSVKDILIAVGILVGVFLVNAFLGLAATLAPFLILIGVIALLRNVWESNWLGIRDTLTEVWNNTILPAIQQLVAWLQEYIPIAIQWLSDYWNNVLYPALLNFWAWVQTYVFPIIELWWEWLQNFIPAAIQFLSNLWSNVLWPALQAVWTWISTVLFPLFVQFYEWLFTTIPEAVSFLQEVWTILVDFWETSLKPLLEALGELLSVTLALAVEALAGLWENVLLPALTAIWEFIQDNLGPIFEKIADYLSTTFGEKLGTAEGFLETLKDVFGELGTKISGVVDWVKDLADRLSKLKLPAFLQRKSPSPFEQTLDGVAQGLRDINRQALPDFGSNLDSLRAPNLAGATPAAAPITVNVNVDRVGSDMDLNNIAYRVAEEISRRQRR